MREARLGSLLARIEGGTDRQGGGDGPVVVLLHGFGAPGEDLVPLGPALDLPREVRFVFPEGPLGFEGVDYFYPDARAWWMIDVAALERGDLADLVRREPAGMAEARAAMDALLGEVERELRPSHVILGGFSQGAMLSVDVALRTSRRIDALAVLSGALVADEAWRPRFASRRGLPVFQSHGEADPLLPFPVAELLRERMVEGGLDVDFLPFDGGHEIPPEALGGLAGLVRRVTGV
jgi:phospholipase/carboxylesterase